MFLCDAVPVSTRVVLFSELLEVELRDVLRDVVCVGVKELLEKDRSAVTDHVELSDRDNVGVMERGRLKDLDRIMDTLADLDRDPEVLHD